MSNQAAQSGASKRGPILLILALIGGVVIGQLGGEVKLAPPPPPATASAAVAPAIPSFGRSIDASSRDDFLGYARALPFDGDPGAGDGQRLVSDSPLGSQVPGPLVRIEPMRHAAAASRAELANGLVVARFINEDSLAFPRLALGARDTAYWWVDSVGLGRWRSVYLSARASIGMLPAGLEVRARGGAESSAAAARDRALARWHWEDDGLAGERPWATCSRAAACIAQ